LTCSPRQFRETSDLILSTIGIGTARGEADDTVDCQIRRAIVRSIAAGINVLDTSANYRDGRSERAVGAAVRTAILRGEVNRDELFIASKGGYMPLAPGSSHELAAAYLQSISCPQTASETVSGCHSIHPEFLAHELSSSRANLGLETLDVYYLHNPEVQLREVERCEFRRRLYRAFVFLEEMCRLGTIRRYGVATWHGLRVPEEHQLRLDLPEIGEIARAASGDEHHHWAYIQAPLNPLMPELAITRQCMGGIETPVIEAANQLGVSVIASASLAQGRSLGSFRRAMGPAVTSRWGDSEAQCSLQFTRSIPGVVSCLVGMKTDEHVDEIISMTRRDPLLPEELLASLAPS
jgi:aryl-alcohol dehydrogenase-like predicted oxidoreductase